MNASLFSKTPAVKVIDNRGLAVREVTYHRHPDSPRITDERITRHRYDERSNLIQSTDPRLYDAGLVNFSYLTDFAGNILLTRGADNGTTVALNDAAGRPFISLSNINIRDDGMEDKSHALTRSWQYEDAGLPGRLLSIMEQMAGEAEHIAERFVWAGHSDAEKALNLAGAYVSHYDTAGQIRTNSISLTAVPLSVTRRLPKDADNPDAVVDWSGTDTSAWHQQLEAQEYVTVTTVDATGAMLSSTDAEGNIQRVAYDVAGLLSGSWLTAKGRREQVIIRSLTYSAAGQKLREEHGNGVVTSWTFEPETQRLVGIKTERPTGHLSGAKVLQDLRYQYDPVGNVLKVSNDAEETRFWRNQKVVPENTYAYDSLYQLVSTTGREMANVGQQSSSLPAAISPLPTGNSTYTNYTRTYAYDVAGNLTQIRHSAPLTNHSYTRRITVSNRSNRGVLSTITGNASDVEALFMGGGQQKQLQPGQSLVWTPRNELLRVRSVARDGSLHINESYRYDGSSRRILKLSSQKKNGGTQVKRVLYLSGLEVHTTQTSKKETERLTVITVGEAGRSQVRVLHWMAGKPEDISNNQVRWRYDNLTGSSGLELDAGGNIISMEEYYPYGGTAVLLARSQTEAAYKTIRYSGRERDATGLYYYGYRYYQPWAGRWLSADPAGTVDGLNLFRMCRNNPVSGIDNDGRMFKRITSTSQAGSTASSVTLPDYPLPESARVSADDVSLSPAEIRQHKKAISEGEYPQNIIRHNFLYGKEGLPEPVNMPQDLDKKGITREAIAGNFLQAVDKLTSYSGGKVIYRGTMVPDEHFTSMQPGSVLQSHQLSFFSESNLVSMSFIDSSEAVQLHPVIFKVKDVPANVFKEGLLSPMAYDDLKNRLSRKGVDGKKMKGIGSTVKEIISVPGALFEITEVKKIKSELHKNKITQVKLKFAGTSKGVHNQTLF
ncbi:RHS repeat domain-containing protein [Erwinia mallotivora]|uniref:RHS repeat domain-containing protein n=1 Tax=Erwinia mallotivora TaxID=69222 RepID=UPI0021BEC4A3